MTEIAPRASALLIDRAAVLQYLRLNPTDVKTQALLAVCERYGLDPLLKHVVLVDGNLYVTRDGLLHVAHASGVFDGMTVDSDPTKGDTHWSARVSVYRKDMSRPFTYPGRYPATGGNNKFAPEMALKCAEVMALRRAFDVSLAAREERFDLDDESTPLATAPHRPPAPVATGLSADRYDSPQQSASQAPAPPVAPVSPEPMPDDLRDLLLAAWSDLDADEARQVWRLCIERGVDKEAPTADDRGQPTTMRALFSYAGRRILEGERPAGVSGPDALGPGHTAESVVDAVIVDQSPAAPPRQERAERIPQIPPDDPWYTDQPEPAADGSHPMDLPIPEHAPSPSAAAREAARKATRRAPAGKQ